MIWNKLCLLELLGASKQAFGALVGAHACDDSVQGRARIRLLGVLQKWESFSVKSTEEIVGIAMKQHAEWLMAGYKEPEASQVVVDKNCLSYWFPKLEAAGVPVPKTEILVMPEEVRSLIWKCFDGKAVVDLTAINQFAAEIEAAAKRIAGPDKKYYPYFLRTGQTSHKHDWQKTCWCSRDSDIPKHILALAEFSECADFIGLPWHIWAVREMLPTQPIAILPRYGNFPLVPEVRCFIKGGEIQCSHGYWPEEAIRQGGCDSQIVIDAAQLIPDLFDGWVPMVEQVAAAFADDEAFSVDVLPTERGWFVTDMALASRSFHWAGCPNGR